MSSLLPPPYWPMRAPHSSWRNSSKPSTETFSPFSSQTYQVPTVGPSLLSQWRHVQLLLKDIVPQTLSFLTFSRNLLLSCILQIKLISLLCLNASVNSLPLRRTSKFSQRPDGRGWQLRTAVFIWGLGFQKALGKDSQQSRGHDDFSWTCFSLSSLPTPHRPGQRQSICPF